MKTLRYFVLIWGLIFSMGAWSWHLADVAVLLPLANTAERIELHLKPSDQGRQGELLPQHLGENLLDLIPEASNAAAWSSLRVLAVRVDPCFVEGSGPWRCQAQVRLVWQPILKRGVRLIEARDAAVHSFYNLSKRQFEAFLRQWSEVSAEGQELVLGIHPLIAAEGLEGETWNRMKEVLLNFIGEERLVRVTQMNVLAGEQIWTFAGFDYNQGQVTPIVIPLVGEKTQGVIQGSSTQVFSGRMVPEMPSPLGRFIENSRVLESYTDEQVRSLIQEVADLENPRLHNSGTVDCASCHMAHSVHQWLSGNVDLFRYQVEWGEVPRVVPGPVRTNQLRAMGYFSRWPVISTRTLTESQESLWHMPAQ